MKIVECVPNFSEGRRPEVIDAIVAPFRATPGVLLLDVSSDRSHNRTVVTAVGSPEAISEALFLAISEAARLIDMREHSGEHPRMGATDVVPFVPIRDVDLADCVLLSRALAERVAGELGIPVILYEEAATAPHRRSLAEIRSGEFEGWQTKILEAEWQPDFGPALVHSTAGVTVIGARMPLVAYNVNLGTGDMSIARRIARKVREKSGGLTNVRAIGVELKDKKVSQVSMNLTDYTKTPIYRALEAVRTEARRYGVPVLESEIVGLVPMRALTDSASYYLQLEGFSRKQILETRIRALEAAAGGPTPEPSDPLDFANMTLGLFADKLSSSEPTPGGGTASAVAVSFAAALTGMVCRLTLGRAKFRQFEAEVTAALSDSSAMLQEALRLARLDSLAFNKVMAAFGLPKATPEEQQVRSDAIEAATLAAAEVPLKVAKIGLEISQLSKSLKGKTNPNAASDLAVAGLLAGAGAQGALENVRINASSLKGSEATRLIRAADEISQRLSL